jgi:ferritin-like protein
MALLSRQLVEKAGIDVDALVQMLIKNAAAELTTFLLLHHPAGEPDRMEGEGLKEIVEDARIEDRNHSSAVIGGSTNWAGSCRIA